MTELLVLIVLVVIAAFFLSTSIKARSKRKKYTPTHALVPSADEDGPSQTGRFRVKTMLNKQEKKARQKQKTQPVAQADSDDSLPDPFAD